MNFWNSIAVSETWFLLATVLHLAVGLVSRCESCDDTISGRHCDSNSVGTNCLGDEPYCLARVSSTFTGILFFKGCASESTCISDWWIGTSNNSHCSRNSVDANNIPLGTTCTFCCHDPSPTAAYCNHPAYPNSLVQFSGTELTTITPTSTPMTIRRNNCPVCVRDTTTGQDCDIYNQIELCSQSTPYCMTSFYREPTAYRIEKRCASQTVCETLWVEGTLQQQAECLRSGLKAENGNHLECHYCCENSLAGNLCNADMTHVIPQNLLEEMTSECMECSLDNTGHPTCNPTNDTVTCTGALPLCMTSYYTESTSYRVDKRCASVSECSTLWQTTTSRPQCSGSFIHPATSATSTECHFCCNTQPNSDICNRDSNNVVPENVIDFKTPPIVTVPPYNTTTGVISVVMCPNCKTDSRTGEVCDDMSSIVVCQGSAPYCITSLYRDPDGYTIYKRCGGADECRALWWTQTAVNDECLSLSSGSEDGDFLECHYCCASHDQNNPFCNVDHSQIVPNHPLIMGDTCDNRLCPEFTSATPAGSVTHTSPKLDTTPTASGYCQVCFEDQGSMQSCSEDDYQFCSDEEPYCMNIVTVRNSSGHTSVTVQKSCAERFVCQTDWYEDTRLRPECMQIPLTPPQHQTRLECRYCCSSWDTHVACNTLDVPTNLLGPMK